MSMKQFITVLVAALFAAASVTAIAQQKAEKAEKTEKSMSKKDAPKKEQTAAQKRQQERRMACNDQASERKLQGDERKKFVSSCLKPAAKGAKTQTKAVGKKDEKTK